MTAPEILEGYFSDNDASTIVKFVTYADDLLSVECVRKGTVASLKLSADDQGMSVSTYPRSELDELLMALRPFILDNETTHFMKVLNIICRTIPDTRVRRAVGDIRAIFSKNKGGCGPFRVMVGKGECSVLDFVDGKTPSNALHLDSDLVLDWWLNGFKFHRDESKRAKLLDAFGGFSVDLVMSGVLPNLSDKVWAIRCLADMLRGFAVRVGSDVAQLRASVQRR